ncbi:PAS/PAC sensor hybrid histidine kinase [Chitinispirillum alkaliphilum]|nr:PAS/PAC sensor hybrid histidine kinase [Chitinispirillum alkaliphilum]
MQDKSIDVEKLLTELDQIRSDNSALKDRLDRISGITTAIIYVLDTDGKFTYVNQAVESILKFKPQDLLGQHFSTIMPKAEYEKVARSHVLPVFHGKVTGGKQSPRLFDERRTGERRTRNLEVKLYTKNNDDVKILVGDVTGIVDVEGAYRSGISVVNKSEGFIGSQGIIFDITKYKKAERERLVLQKSLFEAQKMDAIGKLAGKVAHDLNNKLGSIIGSAEMLKQDYGLVNKELTMYIETILSASRHAANLSGKLLEFSYKADNNCQNVDMHNLADNVLGFIRPTIEESIIINKKYHSVNPIVTGSISQLQNALLNLIVNACDAMSITGGMLTVQTDDITVEEKIKCISGFYAKPGNYLRISVQDTGTGIDEKIFNRIFEPFFTTKTEGKFIGLGLPGVRDCVRYLGGFIQVESKCAKGSVFKIHLPNNDI